jgi:hypothetical protein
MMEEKVTLLKRQKCSFKIRLPAIIWKENKEAKKDQLVYRKIVKVINQIEIDFLNFFI